MKAGECGVLDAEGVRSVPVWDDRDRIPCDPDAQPFALTWYEGTRRIVVAREVGYITHPGCRDFRGRGWCGHVAAGIALTEQPLATLPDILMSAWQVWGHRQPEVFASAAYRAAEAARRRERERREWLERRRRPAPSAADVFARLG